MKHLIHYRISQEARCIIRTLKEISVAYGVDAKLLKQYFQAFANLYGICPLQKALQICNRQNPEQKFTKEQLLGFAEGQR